jgi:hypothetical protein
MRCARPAPPRIRPLRPGPGTNGALRPRAAPLPVPTAWVVRLRRQEPLRIRPSRDLAHSCPDLAAADNLAKGPPPADSEAQRAVNEYGKRVGAVVN